MVHRFVAFFCLGQFLNNYGIIKKDLCPTWPRLWMKEVLRRQPLLHVFNIALDKMPFFFFNQNSIEIFLITL